MIPLMLGFIVSVIVALIVPVLSWQYFLLVGMFIVVSAISYARGLAVAAQMEND